MVGFLAVYRILFAVACFYFLFFITMLFVKNSRDPRSYIQNGYVSCIVVSTVRWKIFYFKGFGSLNGYC